MKTISQLLLIPALVGAAIGCACLAVHRLTQPEAAPVVYPDGPQPPLVYPNGPEPLTEEEFAKLQADLRQKRDRERKARITVLDFYANWCGPCRDAKPKIDQLEREGWGVARLNADEKFGRQNANVYHVSSLPTFVVLDAGVEVFRTGNVNELVEHLTPSRP